MDSNAKYKMQLHFGFHTKSLRRTFPEEEDQNTCPRRPSPVRVLEPLPHSRRVGACLEVEIGEHLAEERDATIGRVHVEIQLRRD